MQADIPQSCIDRQRPPDGQIIEVYRGCELGEGQTRNEDEKDKLSEVLSSLAVQHALQH